MGWKVFTFTLLKTLRRGSAYFFATLLTFVDLIVLKQNVNIQSGVVVIVVVDQEHVVASRWHDSRNLDSALPLVEWHDSDLFWMSNRERQLIASNRFSL